MNLLELVQRVKARIAEPENWTQHVYARGAHQKPLNILNPEEKIFCWCTSGAVIQELKNAKEISPAVNSSNRAFRERFKAVNGAFPHIYNDTHTHTHTHAEVITALTKLEEVLQNE